ncbi:competence protein CoiA family protein [Noviherbaspirillum pedocola]|uniref:Competence protein CoiA-like N-terminal domain-containing protein n=1 Tax=Noviherbaspirillum pedocola TaxID=2801341 RepID=A0A934W4T7_9BURK|nr:competence protein CoiA family protein [Noviherbaspirillum pedocola]MBK4738896.1 hypothetical protein [Noviherbaspirillum pedocola]
MSQKKQPEHGIRFALHLPTQRMVSPAEVKKGLTCDCVCVACGSRLVARKGEIRIAHFAHHQDSNCPHAVEAAIHWMAKQIIAERGSIFVPHRVRTKLVHGKRNVWEEAISVEVQQEGVVEVEDCRVEKNVVGNSPADRFRRPDLIAKLNGIPLAIEIWNTHAVDFEKEKWLEQHGFSVLEINVSDLADLSTDAYRAALEQRLFSQSGKAKWLVHMGDKEAGERLNVREQELRIEKQPEEERLLALLEAREASRKRQEEEWAKEVKEREEAQKREAELREQERDIEEFNFPISNCVVRIGRNDSRVTLKAHGYPTKNVCLRISALAKKHGGRYLRNICRWDFYGCKETKTSFDTLHMHVLGLTKPDFYVILKLAASQIIKAPIPIRPAASVMLPVAPALPQYFDDPALQELFDERAGMLEFESGVTREEAERQSLEYVRSIAQSRTGTSRGEVLHAVQQQIAPPSVAKCCDIAVAETNDDAVIQEPVVCDFAFA